MARKEERRVLPWSKRSLTEKIFEIGLTAQAVEPTLRLAGVQERRTTRLGRWTDVGRVVVGVLAGRGIFNAAEQDVKDNGHKEGLILHTAGKAKEVLQQGVKLPFGDKDHQAEVPGWVIGAGATAAVAGGLALLNHAEHDRHETAVQEAPQEADAVQKAFLAQEAKKEAVKIGGKNVEVSGTRKLAKDYADKFLQEMLLDKDGFLAQRGISRVDVQNGINEARRLIQIAWDPKNPNPDFQRALLLVGGDSYEGILKKELLETAGHLASRNRDKYIQAIENLPKAVDNVPVLRRFVPAGEVNNVIQKLTQSGLLKVGNQDFDPRMFIGAGNAETIEHVRDILQERFQAMQSLLADELSHDATGADVDAINKQMRLGRLRVSAEAKDGDMNKIIGMVLAQEVVNVPPLLGVIGTLDAVQNNAEKVFGEAMANEFPSHRRRGSRLKAA